MPRLPATACLLASLILGTAAYAQTTAQSSN
jgi:hypothetical protein